VTPGGISGPILGMPTLLELPDLAANVELCRRLGLAFVELNLNCPQFLPDALSPDAAADLSRKAGVELSVHLPDDLDLASFQRDFRAGHAAFAAAAVEWAHRASARRVTMHLSPGTYFTLPEGKVWLYRKHRDLWLENLEESVGRIAELPAATGCKLLIENTGRFHEDFAAEGTERLLARFAPLVGLTWDVGHDVATGRRDAAFLTRHAGRVAEMHLHDWDGRSAHLPLFTGQADIEGSLAFARELGIPVVIETKTAEAVEASVRALRERGLA